MIWHMKGSRVCVRRILYGLILALPLSIFGCEHTSVSTGVAVHSGSWGWGNSYSTGVYNHHYRRPSSAYRGGSRGRR
jgi:hypothetical protein